MKKNLINNQLILGLAVFFGLSSLGFLLSNGLIRFKEYERTVTVKGLSEREYPADVVNWPIAFTETGNNLDTIYKNIDKNTGKILSFLKEAGFSDPEINISKPSIIDKVAQSYGTSDTSPALRFVATQVITVYSNNVDLMRASTSKISELGKSGILFSNDEYRYREQFYFTKLNDIKPEMIEESTKMARLVGEKFAQDSNSKLGKIKTAYQGQFSISSRDADNPHIKNVRVVSTIVYYLSD